MNQDTNRNESRLSRELLAKKLTLALIYLTSFEDSDTLNFVKAGLIDAPVTIAWKGYDFDILNQLEEEQLIDQGKYKSKKLTLFPTGKIEAEQLVVALERAMDKEIR
ncbi:MAG: DUF6429 family protein [Bacillota bacterium]|nr:DUF6429 family protein [Bacillota bacterium]